MHQPAYILQPVLSEKLEGYIWKIETGQETGLIAIESRDPESRQAAFSVMDFITGKVYFRERSYDRSGQLNLAWLGRENLILHGYEGTESPESKGITCIDSGSGEIIWQKFNVSLDYVTEYGLRVYDPRLQPRKYTWLDHLSGTDINAPQGTETEREDILFPRQEPGFRLPGFTGAGEIAGGVQILHYNSRHIVAFHEINDGIMQQRIIVYQDDSILLDDILISGIQKLQPEAFFIQQKHLIYIRDKKRIISYLV